MTYIYSVFISLMSCVSLHLCSGFQISNHVSLSVHCIINKQTRYHFASSTTVNIRSSSNHFASTNSDIIAEEETYERTRKQLQVLAGQSSGSSYEDNSKIENNDADVKEKEIMYQAFIKKPANDLKEELTKLKLSTKGRKPDLARRLVDHNFLIIDLDEKNNDSDDVSIKQHLMEETDDANKPIKSFASIELSHAAGRALAIAGFTKPTKIQSSALPSLVNDGESLILHAETGSGKTLCYLLPITESLWKNEQQTISEDSYALILTPTRCDY